MRTYLFCFKNISFTLSKHQEEPISDWCFGFNNQKYDSDTILVKFTSEKIIGNYPFL